MPKPRWSESSSILLFVGDKVCMVRRSGASRFMPHALVFPGGKLEEEDRLWAKDFAHKTTTRCCCSRCHGAFTDIAYRKCALRELKEETAIELNAAKTISKMVYLCQFQTPDYEALRTKKGGFITRFYVCALSSDSEGSQALKNVATCDGQETTQLVDGFTAEILDDT
ncbi:hypothetical protein FOL47_007035 [Perkinsus chesapeaki]|uniref:Nudix hydrolase domain-containing protein n=1 Tax=Perkinsus chesapeaki TaxID=330153 RepID=A0A7J6LNI8_PERCH|nr:hypothetical protein FOL47_007035 [Perkinsus chesapeaki]